MESKILATTVLRSVTNGTLDAFYERWSSVYGGRQLEAYGRAGWGELGFEDPALGFPHPVRMHRYSRKLAFNDLLDEMHLHVKPDTAAVAAYLERLEARLKLREETDEMRKLEAHRDETERERQIAWQVGRDRGYQDGWDAGYAAGLDKGRKG